MNKNILIRMNSALHTKLKEKSYHDRKSLNQTCIDIFEVYFDSTEVKQTSKGIDVIQDCIVDELIQYFGNFGLIAILSTEGYIADYVLIFSDDVEMPSVQLKFLPILQAIKFPKNNLPPNTMWIQIAKCYELKFASTKATKDTISNKLNEWQ